MPEKLARNPKLTVIKIAALIVLTELSIMLVKDAILKSYFKIDLPDVFWDYADAIILTLLLAPALYRLVFQPLQFQHQQLERQNLELRRLATRVQEEERALQAQHRRELEARERMIQIEKLSSMGTMVGGVAHEINNPLMGILNYVEYAQEKATDDRSRAVLDDALHEIHRIKKIVSNMLIFVRPGAGASESCSVPATVQQTLDLLAGELHKNGVQVSLESSADLPDIRCSAGSLQQVLVNLVLNARDAIAGQSEQRILLRVWREDDRVILRVCDNGPGIPPELRERIFEPFFTTKPVGQGTGLGLAVSRRLIEETGGTINPCIEDGYGGCFRLVFVPAKIEHKKLEKQNDRANSGN
ncbi:hypothetical protein UT4_16570 [Ferrigenium sp. UT4]